MARWYSSSVQLCGEGASIDRVVVDMGSIALITAATVACRGFVELVGTTLVETLQCVRLVAAGHAKVTFGTASSSSMRSPRRGQRPAGAHSSLLVLHVDAG